MSKIFIEYLITQFCRDGGGVKPLINLIASFIIELLMCSILICNWSTQLLPSSICFSNSSTCHCKAAS